MISRNKETDCSKHCAGCESVSAAHTKRVRAFNLADRYSAAFFKKLGMNLSAKRALPCLNTEEEQNDFLRRLCGTAFVCCVKDLDIPRERIRRENK